jgi:outer membrane immunogenic protein
MGITLWMGGCCMIGRIALTAVSVIALAAAAKAADMYVPGPAEFGGYKDAPVASGWSGFYIGVNGGGGWANTDFPPGFAYPVQFGINLTPPPSQSSGGGLAGGHAGYNLQYGRIVGGLEVDFDTADIKSTANLGATPPSPMITHQVKIDELASIRARIGWEVQPGLLAYGTGGLALGHFQSFMTQTNDPTINLNTLNSNSGNNEVGWVAGAGLEYKLFDNWLLRAEYLHYGFGTVGNNNFQAPLASSPNTDNTVSRTTVDIVRGGLSYKFGAEGPTADWGLKDAPHGPAWAGFYIGLNGGGGWAQTDYPFGVHDGPHQSAPSQGTNGGLFGGQLGYNWQSGRLVGGLEVDYDAANIESKVNYAAFAAYANSPEAVTQQAKIDQLASVRARLGWEVWPNLLAYGTGGIGLGHFQYTITSTIPAPPAPWLNMTSDGTQFGWVAGAGLEYKLLDNWMLRAEYLHYDFGTVNNSFGAGGASIDAADIRNTVDVVRGGLSYKFGPAGTAEASLKDPASVSDWSGLYAGINGGGGWAQTDFPSAIYWVFAYTPPPSPSQNSSGGLVGGQLGYNWQYGRAVAGLEADIDAANIGSTLNLAAAGSTYSHTFKIDELASIRGRLGWEVRPGLLAYGTAGLGFGHFQASMTKMVPGLSPFVENGGDAELGWVAGAGLEYEISGHWLLRAEYLHYDFGTVNNLYLSVVPIGPSIDASVSRTTVDAVRGGLSYKF